MALAFVTGATGFLGSWVARELIQAGHTVRILRRSTSRLDAIQDLNYQEFIGDITDLPVLDQALHEVDWVFHVAAISAYWRNDKESLFKVNVDGTRLLLERCEQAKIKRFIFTSSAAAIGYREDGHAADETNYFNLDPRISPYGLSKALAESEVHRAIQHGLDSVILNPAVIIGPGDLNKISGSLIIEPAKQRQPFMPMQGGVTMIDVRDVAKSHIVAATQGRTGERYLLGAVDVSHRAFFKMVAQVAGVRPPMIPTPAALVDGAAFLADVAKQLKIPLPSDVEGNQLRLSKINMYFNCQKSWRELHKPEYDLLQSITDTYQWYREHGEI
jgi:dihydroflavonol-4-reductase